MRSLVPSICRFCPAMCGMLIHIENERVVKAEGDHQNPLFKGFSCPKGRAAPAQLYSPQRLLQSLKRKPDGSYETIPTALALDEIAAKLQTLIRDHGPRSVAVFLGGYLFIYSEMLSVGVPKSARNSDAVS